MKKYYTAEQLREYRLSPGSMEKAYDDITEYYGRIKVVCPDAFLKYYISKIENGIAYVDYARVCIMRDNLMFWFSEYQKKSWLNIVTEHLQNYSSYDEQQAKKELIRPNEIGQFTKRKVEDWVNYLTQYYRNLKQSNDKNYIKIELFRKRMLEQDEVEWEDENNGFIRKGGLVYMFQITNTTYKESFKLDVSNNEVDILDTFLKISNNEYNI